MLAIFLFELRYYFKNLKELIQISCLFVSITIIYPFGQLAALAANRGLASSALWIALILAVMLSGATLYQRDSESGRLEAYQLLERPLETLFFAKWLAYGVAVTLPILIMLPLSMMLLGLDMGELPRYALGLGSGAIALTLLSALASAMLAGLEKAGAILSLMILPLSIPVLIFGQVCFCCRSTASPALPVFERPIS